MTEKFEGRLVLPNLPYPYTQPKTICRCDLFGQGQMVISFYEGDPSPLPNRWIRFWMTLFFNSKWNFEK